MEKTREFQKSIYICFIDYVKALHVWITTNCKILQENIRSPYLFPEKPNAGQETRVRASHGTTDWFKIGKGV